MDSVARICALSLFTISTILGLLALAPEAAFQQFDPSHPTTLLPVVTAGAHEVLTLVYDWVGTTFGHLREVFQRTTLRQELLR